MNVLLLLVVLAAVPRPVAFEEIQVSIFEINELERGRRQAVLWRWHRLGDANGYRVSQWWWLDDDTPVIARRDGKWVIYTRGRVFLADHLRETKGVGDTEFADRKRLAEDSRTPYFEDEVPPSLVTRFR